MADTVTATYLLKGQRSIAVLLTGISDGTGESNVVKVDKSTITNILGNEPGAIVIDKIKWTMAGIGYAKLSFDHTTDDTAVVLCSGIGKLCFSDFGGLKDPSSAGGTGDLLLTTAGATSGGAYSIFIEAHF